MEQRAIGSLRVSVVGLGCNNFGMRIDAAASDRVVGAALDAGITFFDTADIYGGTKVRSSSGKHSRPTARGHRCHEVRPARGRATARGAAGVRPAGRRGQPKRLGTDCIDLYQLHQPDPEVPIADTLGALNELVKAGKVKEIGCSNFSAGQLEDASRGVAPGAARFVSVQNEYSVLNRDPESSVLPGLQTPGHGLHSLLSAGERTVDRQVRARADAARRQPARAPVGGAFRDR